MDKPVPDPGPNAYLAPSSEDLPPHDIVDDEEDDDEVEDEGTSGIPGPALGFWIVPSAECKGSELSEK